MNNLEEKEKLEIVSRLKIELAKHRNVDIHEPLAELLYKMPLAS